MFDWVPKKNIIQEQKKKERTASLDDIFAIDENAKKDQQSLISQEEPKQKPKAPQKQEPAKSEQASGTESTPPAIVKEEIQIIEPTIKEPAIEKIKQEVREFSLDDGKISPTGAASKHQDEVRSTKTSKDTWEIPNILDFLNEIDTQSLFTTPIKDLKPIKTEEEKQKEKQQPPMLMQKAPPIPVAKLSNKSAPKELENEPSSGKIEFTNIDDDDDGEEDELIKKLIKSRYPYGSGKDNFDTDLRSTSSPYINAFTDTKDAPPTMIVDDFGDRTLWELQLNNSNLPGMELEEFTLMNFDHIHLGEMRRGFKRARRDFIKFISYHNQQDLYAAGLEDTDIALLRKGYVCENFNIHRKVPYEYGGNNDFSNFCLIQTHPYHDNLHKFLDMQIFIHPKGAKVKRLFIPVPSGNVYVPYLDIAGSGGKNKHDRSVYAGFEESTFNLIAQKTAMGKAAEL